MGLTVSSTGSGAVDFGFQIQKRHEKEKIIALAGNPNVGKSTVFNALTGMKQHTGNWPGKTVCSAIGRFSTAKYDYTLVDTPGTYSLSAHSAEEEVARDFICSGKADIIAVVCDATCIERNLNLVLQISEVHDHIVVIVNMMDEAKRKNIHIDLPLISKRLGIPVIGICAQKKKTLAPLLAYLDEMAEKGLPNTAVQFQHEAPVSQACEILRNALKKADPESNLKRYLQLRLLTGEYEVSEDILLIGSISIKREQIQNALALAHTILQNAGFREEDTKDAIAVCYVKTAEKICENAIHYGSGQYSDIDRRVDGILTGKCTGFLVILLFFGCVFWLTIEGTNILSDFIGTGLDQTWNLLSKLLTDLKVPQWIYGPFMEGAVRTLFFIVSVMLPPMAVFFPLFTLMEDAGYLPRIAYNLDKPFHKCKACGKQALTMCMGFGCNAAGVVGCRIIDSERERLLAVLTNNFVPCNGRFPTLIALVSIFFIGTNSGKVDSVWAALAVSVAVMAGILLTFFVTRILSLTLLKGEPSSFTLELPPYRKPQIKKVIVRSIFDRTLFVLGRAATVAAPAGMVLWILSNSFVNGTSLLVQCASFFEPLGKLMGLDGVILISFLLGFPANEIVLPIMIMAYTASGNLTTSSGLSEIETILKNNGWTAVTAVSFIIFSLSHFPCSTALLTIKKETGSMKWTLISAIIPTALGIILCIGWNALSGFFF